MEASEKLQQINLLVAEGKFDAARTELEKLAPSLKTNPDPAIVGEYHYLVAAAGFSNKPHAEVLEIARKAYSLVSSTAENLLVGRIQALLGKVYVALGDLRSGEEFIRDAISSFRRIECETELVACYNKLGQVYFVRGEFKQAEEFLNRAIELLAQDTEASPLALVRARGNHARVRILLGQWEEAEPVLQECVEFCRTNQISVSLVKNLLSLGYVKYLKGNYPAARELYQEAHSLIQAGDMYRDRSIYHEYMGDLMLALGDYNMARQHYGYSLEIGYRIAPKSAIISQTERRLAELEFDCHNYALAAEHAARAEEVAQQVGEVVEIAAARKILAALAVREGKETVAVKLFDQSIAALESCGCLSERAQALFVAGRSLVSSAAYGKLAARHLQAAAKLAEQLHADRLLADCYYQMGRLVFRSGDYDYSLECLERCAKVARESGGDLLLEECRVLRLAVEERLIDSGLSSDNHFTLFSSFLNASEYGHLKSGNLEKNLKILQSRVNADRAFVLAYDPAAGKTELLAALEFEQAGLERVISSLDNGRGGSIPLDRPLFVSTLDIERTKMFDYVTNGSKPIATLITIPIELADDATGILYLDRLGQNGKPFTATDLNFAIAFSDIIAFKSSEEQKRRLSRDNKMLKNQLQQELAFPNIITANREILKILERVAQVKDSPISILIEGETGTGKDHLAKAIHYNSNRKERRFVSVNCAAIPETLLESELFGHKRGAYTGAESDKIGLFEEADGGTFFLDEIGDMPLSVQVKLLRVIEEKELVRLGETVPRQVDVRVISATNHNLKESMETGKFRQDLYYRLSTFSFRIPPLRERREDIPLLIKHFLARIDPEVRIEPEAFSCFCDYNWPGNVRELENELRKMALLAGDRKVINRQLLSRRIIESVGGSVSSSLPDPGEGFSLYDHLAGLEREYIIKALRGHKWVKKHAAQSLAIPESTLRLKIKQYDIVKD